VLTECAEGVAKVTADEQHVEVVVECVLREGCYPDVDEVRLGDGAGNYDYQNDAVDTAVDGSTGEEWSTLKELAVEEVVAETVVVQCC